MIRISNINCSSMFGLDYMYIRFEIQDTDEDITNYRFSLFRANSENDTFECVYSDIQEFECRDYSVNLRTPQIKYYYKIEIEDLTTGKKEYSEIFKSPAVNGDNYTDYFCSLYDMYLDAVIDNSEFVILRRKRTGQLCECFDDIRGTTTKQSCTCCYGTRFVGGFYNPVVVKINLMSSPYYSEKFELSSVSEDTSPLQFWMGNYPEVRAGDIVVNTATNERYTIVGVQQSMKKGFLIRQTVQMQKIQHSSVLYKIPI